MNSENMNSENMNSENMNFEKLNVLVVDDNEHMLRIAKSLLHALGVKNVRAVTGAAKAFKELGSFPVDLVICDWLMQPLDGIDLVRQIRTSEDSLNRFIPIVMLTGHTELRHVIEARDVGVTEFLAKPISAKALYSRIHSIVSHPREFVKTKVYFGPDRRRRIADFAGADRRGREAGEDGLSEADIESLRKADADKARRTNGGKAGHADVNAMFDS